MGNPYEATFIDQNAEGRLVGEIDFTNPANRPGGSSAVLTADLQLSNDDMLHLVGSPVPFIAGVPGFAIELLWVHAVVDTQAGAYTLPGAGDQVVSLQYTSLSIALLDFPGGMNTLLTNAGLKMTSRPFLAMTASGGTVVTSTPTGQGLVVTNNGSGDEYGGGNAANTVSLRVYYALAPAAAFGM